MLTQEQRLSLQQAKRLPLILLLVVTAGFIATALAGSRWGIAGQAVPLWLVCLRAICEAAMVGALADWFARFNRHYLAVKRPQTPAQEQALLSRP